jgi:hypothetical protein
MKTQLSGLILISSLAIFTSCIGGGGGGGGSSSKTETKGYGYFTRTAGPSVASGDCYDHTAVNLGSSACSSIGGAYNTGDVDDQCVGASGSDNTCSSGTAVTTCRYYGVDLSLVVAYSQSVKETCENSNGVVVTSCSEVTQGNCASTGGEWKSVTTTSCSGFDVSTANNCAIANGKFFPSAEYVTGSFTVHPDGFKIFNGNNKVLTSGLTDDGSNPDIFFITASVELMDWDYNTTNWSGSLNLTPSSDFYSDDNGNLYFDVTSNAEILRSNDYIRLFIDRLYFQ